MNSNYQTVKYKQNQSATIDELISIEEPLEMIVRYKKNNNWIDNSISVTMRTPKNDEDLIVGLLFSEGIIHKLPEIEKIESLGHETGKFKLRNKIRVTLNNGENLDVKHLRRNFLTNSSCGVCGKASMDSLEIICKTKINKNNPKIKSSLVTAIPNLLKQSQSEFSKTGGIHASALFDQDGKVLVIREDVGRHNALDKVIGHCFKNSILDTKNQFIACSGRLSFELIQKTLMANIGLLMGVGAPTSLAIDLAKRFDITLIGFIKSDSFNVYCGENRILK
ncbi:MAG: formate dehydrogenase family accessory protein FdhD [Candidatus Pelagibacter sp.]|jgi:FdhD protein|nr:formate dehydrogenase family accessory protein FdhD [Candidatus Pelagibacter sp.]MDP6784684.1 formate dehydrogenase accessory sulfurtransferase FdhD [Alphaproteobacteria bacterium]|tara:strand:+ start:8274 stop:9110 length:837 start_codon:yes stop_codon:yes gene_type:complete